MEFLITGQQHFLSLQGVTQELCEPHFSCSVLCHHCLMPVLEYTCSSQRKPLFLSRARRALNESFVWKLFCARSMHIRGLQSGPGIFAESAMGGLWEWRNVMLTLTWPGETLSHRKCYLRSSGWRAEWELIGMSAHPLEKFVTQWDLVQPQTAGC